MKGFLLRLFAFAVCSQASAQEFIPLWPGGKKPNSNGKIVNDTIYDERIRQVGSPGIYAFVVPKNENKCTAVLICPGGGYQYLSHLYNGFSLAKWYNNIGVTAFVLVYRLPHQSDLQQRETAPLQDAQRAIKVIRAQASKWKIRPEKIGVMGTSAGGHLASTLGTHLKDISDIGDSLDNVNSLPDFMVLLSPVISMGKYTHAGSKKNLLGPNPGNELTNKYSNELQVSPFTPATFMVHALNDSTVNVQNSLMFYNALLEKKVPASIHIFPQGAHGIRIDDNPGSTDLWLTLLEMWLKEMSFVTSIK